MDDEVEDADLTAADRAESGEVKPARPGMEAAMAAAAAAAAAALIDPFVFPGPVEEERPFPPDDPSRLLLRELVMIRAALVDSRNGHYFAGFVPSVFHQCYYTYHNPTCQGGQTSFGSMKKSVLSTNTQSRFALVGLDSVEEPSAPRLTCSGNKVSVEVEGT